ncbi:MAG: DUF2207 domain-containing protein [Verrucomicrobiales bacterium]|nr:DUF2207 domain-containing protein [Verrucomicrobiales bacterium]
MKRIGRIFATIALVVTALSGLTANAAESILSFDSEIQVQENGILRVTETIRVRAEGRNIKRGIYRDFPTLYRGTLGLKQTVDFSVKSVTRDGETEQYILQPLANGIRVRMGKSSVLLKPGEYTYTIIYETDRQVGFFKKHDELYWNVTGNDWAFPIEKTSATVKLPSGAEVDERSGYAGAFGSKEQAVSVTALEGGARFDSTRTFVPGEGLTIVVTWQKGLVQPSGKPVNLFADNVGIFVGLFGLVAGTGYFVFVWLIVGRDPAKGTIIPLFAPPEELSPAATRYLSRMKMDDEVYSVAILGLAAKRWIDIEEKKKRHFTLKKQNKGKPLTDRERAVLDCLFTGRSKTLELKNSNYVRIRNAKKTLESSLKKEIEKVYFHTNFRWWLVGCLGLVPWLGLCLFEAHDFGKAFTTGIILGIAFVMFYPWTSSVFAYLRANGLRSAGSIETILATAIWIGFATMFWFMTIYLNPWVMGILLASLGLVALFHHLLKAPTKIGRRLMDRIDGFRLYLSVAERDELRDYNPPEDTVETYEAFLPYALALGVEQKWSERFSSVLELAAAASGESTYRPHWYHGVSQNANLAPSMFATAVGATLASAVSSSSTAPGSSSGSRSSGGGYSGGGGGGGGGGGW